jgi:hypothetical protein
MLSMPLCSDSCIYLSGELLSLAAGKPELSQGFMARQPGTWSVVHGDTLWFANLLDSGGEE